MEQGATISETARILGISENAVLQRIKRGTLSATRDPNRKWRVAAVVTDHRPTNQPIDRPTAPTIDVPMRTQQEGAALVIREAIAPFIERLEAVNLELGGLRAELSHERTTRQQAEDELAAARIELMTLKTASAATIQATGGAEGDIPIVVRRIVPESLRRERRRSWWSRFLHGDFDQSSSPPMTT